MKDCFLMVFFFSSPCSKQILLTEQDVAFIAENYTREAGVRELDRLIAAIMRYAAVHISEKNSTVSEQAMID